MSKSKIGRVCKYLIPVALMAPLAVGVALTIDQFAPEQAAAALGASDRMDVTSTARLALLIGNADYPDANAPLGHPVRDMQALADELRRTGFAVEVKQNLGREDLQRTVDAFQAKIRPGSTALLAYSGFGLQAGRESYMIPVNAQIWKESDISREGVSIDQVLTGMNSRGASIKLAILDASRRNPFERRFRGYSAGLAPVMTPAGSLVISAAPANKIADDIQGGNGLLVGELLKEISSAGISAEQIFHRTRTGVSRASQGEQVPAVSSSLVEDFAFVPGARYASLNHVQNDAAGPLPIAPAPKMPVAAAPRLEVEAQAVPAPQPRPRVEPAPQPVQQPIQRAEASSAPPPAPKSETERPVSVKPALVAADDYDDDEDEDEDAEEPKAKYKGGHIVKRARKAVNSVWDYERRPRVRYSSGRYQKSGWGHGGGGRRYTMHLGVGY